jgi:hypothetical protein
VTKRKTQTPGSANRALHPRLATVLSEIEDVIRRHVVFPSPAAARVLAVWVAETHTWPVARPHATPIVDIYSPEPECGKTTTGEVLAALVNQPEFMSNISPAALYRIVDGEQPTLIWDEFDWLLKSDRRDDVIALLNAGYRAGNAVVRCEPPTFEPRRFDAFCPKVIIRIDDGPLPPTLKSRTLPIELRRRLPDEDIESFRREHREELGLLRGRIAKTVQSASRRLAKARPDGLEGLSDRQAEVVERMAAIADLAGEDRGAQFRQDAIELFAAGNADTDTRTLSGLMLEHIREAFRDATAKQLFSDEIVAALNDREDAPWRRFGNDNMGVDATYLAKRLRSYGIRPQTVRRGEKTAKGYKRTQFEDVWKRYRPLETDELARLRSTTPTKGRNNPLHRHTGSRERDVVTGGDGPSLERPINGRRRKLTMKRP